MDFILHTDYLTESEITEEIAFESAVLGLDRLTTAYTAMCEKAEMDLREAELKCVEESGNMDDLIALYTEAKENTEEKSQGIFSKIWEGLVNLFNRIKDFFSKKEKDVDPDKKYGMPKGLINTIKSAVNFLMTWVGNAVNGILKWVKDHPVIDVTALGGLSIAIFCNRDKIKDYFKNKEKESIPGHVIIEVINLLKKGASKVMDWATSKKDDKATEDDNKAAGLLTKIAAGMKDVVSSICSFINVKDKSNDASEEETGSNSDNSKGKSTNTSDDSKGKDTNLKNLDRKLDDKDKNNTTTESVESIFGEGTEECIFDQEGYAMEDTESTEEIRGLLDELLS